MFTLHKTTYQTSSIAAFCVSVLAGCGGSSGDGNGLANPGPSPIATAVSAPTPSTTPTTQPSPTPTPVPTPTTGALSSAVIANIELAQSHLFNSADRSLVLVAGKDVLVKVNVTTRRPAEAKPQATLRVETNTGQLVQAITLMPPTGAIPASVPVVPSFTDAYTAVLPGNLVKAGLRLTVSLPNGQNATTITPRVGGGVAIKFVAVPVQIAGTTGQIVASASSYIEARIPAVSVTAQTHLPYTAKGVTVLPTTSELWSSAFSTLLREIDALHDLENAPRTSYYYGYMPKRTFGLAGLGYVPGNAAVGFDLPNNPNAVLETLTHELGHNLSLPHAPCGGPADADTQYPYANAQLGAPGRYIWGYNALSQTFIDPGNTARHDIMSYCDGDTFSDYNYRKIQVHLTPTDAQVRLVAAAPLATGPQDLLLISGEITAGKAQITPPKSFYGEPRLLPDGPYTLRIVSAAKGTLEYRFADKQIDHDTGSQHFRFSIPHPGDIVSMTIVKDGAILMQTAAKTSAATQAAKASAAANTKPQVQVSEQNGKLSLSWDHVKYPYLTVTYVGADRANLAQDLEGGSATLTVGKLPAGGSFEFSLSDGMNAVRLTQSR